MTIVQPIPLLARTASPVPVASAAPVMERARGTARVGMRADGAVTRLVENYQSGSAKMRFTNRAATGPLEVVLLNTAGGVTGGDHLSYAVAVDAGARGVVCTQAAERIYRRSAGVARIETTLSVGAGAALDWLPQETILYDRSALTRTLSADIHADGRLLAVEAIVLGRAAMGETARDIVLADSWRIRRGGRLVFADGLRLAGDSVAILAGGATGGGAAAMATLVLIAPDAEAAIDRARAALASSIGEGGASAWNGMLVARLTAASGQILRADLIRIIEALRGLAMPRPWLC